MMPLKYLTKERKVISNFTTNRNGQNFLTEIPEKIQQQLDYIANAIHDNGFTPDLESFGIRTPKKGASHFHDVKIEYRYNGALQGVSFNVIFDISNVDDTIIEVEVSASKDYHSAIGILKKISEKYFIYLAISTHASRYITSESGETTLVKQPQAIEEWVKPYKSITAPEIDYHWLPRLQCIKIFGKATDYRPLTKSINDCNLTGELEIELYSLGGDNNDDAVLKLIKECKDNEHLLISIKCKYRVSSTIQDELKELNEYTSKRKESVTESMTRLVEAYISSKGKFEEKFEEKFEQILHKEFTQLRKDHILKVLLNFSDDPKIHKMISEKLNSGTKNTANALIMFSIYLLEEYTLSDTNVIEKRKDLSKEFVEIVARFTQLPTELKVKIAGSFPLNNTLLSIIPNEVEDLDLVSKPQEHTTKESDAEAVISDNVLAYDIVDSINTSDQAPEDIPLAGSNESYIA